MAASTRNIHPPAFLPAPGKMLPRWTYARGKPGCPGVAGMSALTLSAGGELGGPGVQDPTREAAGRWAGARQAHRLPAGL